MSGVCRITWTWDSEGRLVRNQPPKEMVEPEPTLNDVITLIKTLNDKLETHATALIQISEENAKVQQDVGTLHASL